MNARMRLLFFTNGLLMRSAGWLVDRCHGWEADAEWRLHVLERMRKDGRT